MCVRALPCMCACFAVVVDAAIVWRFVFCVPANVCMPACV